MNAGIEAVKKTEDTSTLDHVQLISSTSTNNTLCSTSSIPASANFVNSNTEQMTNNYINSIESPGPSDNFVGAQYDNDNTGNVVTATGTAGACASASAAVAESMNIYTDSKLDSSIEQRISLDPSSYEKSQSVLRSSNNTTTGLTNSAMAGDSDGQTTTESGSDDIKSESGDEYDTGDDQSGTDTRNDDKIINDSVVDNRTDQLSSVIPPTTISLEVTASHTNEIDTASPDAVNSNKSSEIFEDNNGINKLANLNEDKESDLAPPVVAQVMVSCPTIDEPERNEVFNRNVDDNNAQPIDERIATNTQLMPKPIAITFETAATMDDVSDTELESYLQELEESCGNLEDLEDSSMGAISTSAAAAKVKSGSIKSASGSIRSNENDAEPYDAIYNIDHTIGSAIDMVAPDARDDRNADSFSQASTVEFGEVNATNSCNEQLPYSEQIIVPAAATATEQIANPIVETVVSVEPEPAVEMQMKNIESHSSHTDANECIEPTQNDVNSEIGGENIESAQRQAPCSSDGLNQPQNECPECEIDQQIMSTVKRPNSLNLQNCNSTLVATASATAVSQSDQIASNSVLNFSSDDNAGNTPPASGLFLSSSISSDDSNIGPTDNNQLNVSDRLLDLKVLAFWF